MYDLTFLHTNYTEKSANYDADGADKYHQAPAFDKEVIDLNKKFPRGKKTLIPFLILISSLGSAHCAGRELDLNPGFS